MSENKRTFAVGAMRTPTPSELKDPILEILADGKTWQFMEIVEELAVRLNLTKADRERERFPNGDDRLPRYCANALAMLRDKDRVVEKLARGSWRRISPTAPKKTTEVVKSRNPAPIPNPISIDLINDKKTVIRNRSRRKSYYGKKIARRRITQRKQYAMKSARVPEPKAVEPAREAKPIESVTPTETKIPWRGPRSKPDPGTYACRTIAQGLVGCGMLLFTLLLIPILDVEGGSMLFLFFLIPTLLLIGGAIHSFLNSRGGW